MRDVGFYWVREHGGPPTIQYWDGHWLCVGSDESGSQWDDHIATISGRLIPPTEG